MKKLLLILVSFIAVLSVSAAKKPNVIIMLADDLGWRDLGCFGSTYFKSPNLDKLAGDGMRFTNAHSSNPSCSPTRASIMAGRNSARLHIMVPCGHAPTPDFGGEVAKGPHDRRATEPNSANRMALDTRTIAQAFKDAGYATSFYGKWHLGRDEYIPENFGFDVVVSGREFPSPPHGIWFSPFEGERAKELQEKVPGTHGNWVTPWPKEANMPKDVPPGTHADWVLTTEAIKFIEENAKAEKPFFMCLWFFSVHAPFYSLPELVEKYKPTSDVKNPHHSPTMAAMIELMDINVGRIQDTLKTLKLDDNTIVIFTSDNGGNMYGQSDETTATNNYPLNQGKGHTLEGGTRIPFIINVPGVVKPNTVTDAMISTTDFFPTLLSLAGLPLEPEAHLDGVDFTPALKGKKFQRPPVTCHYPYSGNSSTSYTDGDWKLITYWYFNPDWSHRFSLFNLKDDISEQNNLAKKYPERVEKMFAAMEKDLKDMSAYMPLKNPNFKNTQVSSWYGDENAPIKAIGRDTLEVNAKAGGTWGTRNTLAHGEARQAIFYFEVTSDADVEFDTFIWGHPKKPTDDKGRKINYENKLVETISVKKGETKKCYVEFEFIGPWRSFVFEIKNDANMIFKDMKVMTPDGSPYSTWNHFDL